MKKIAIIEDDGAIAELERDYLEINGYEAVIAPDGLSGLNLVLEGGCDLVVLDIMLPGMSGFDVLKSLREHVQIPVILLSAKDTEIDKVRGLGLGADDYMVKPFTPGELVARVRAHLDRYERLTSTGARRSAKLDIRGLSIDRDDRRVYVVGREALLTAKEYDLLIYLAENPNRVYNKEELFERVWGMDSMGDSTTVVVHIKKIRDKIEDDPQSPQYIETVWGAGYRMRV